MPPGDGATRTTCLLLAGLTRLGAALRLHGLDAQSLWNDELASITTSQLPTVGQVYWYAGGPQHPPPIISRPPAQLWLLAGHIPCPAELLATLRAAMAQVDERHFKRASVWRFERRQ